MGGVGVGAHFVVKRLLYFSVCLYFDELATFHQIKICRFKAFIDSTSAILLYPFAT